MPSVKVLSTLPAGHPMKVCLVCHGLGSFIYWWFVAKGEQSETISGANQSRLFEINYDRGY